MIRDDGITDSEATSPLDDDWRLGGTAPQPKKAPKSKLDSQFNKALLRKLEAWRDQEWQRQAFNRYQQALDTDYYDHLQWAEEDAQVLMERGQAPVVYNEIKASIDWMIGTERRTRIDYKILPRRKEESDAAEVKTKLMKYISDVNNEPRARSLAFADAVKSGAGWLEVGVRGDGEDEPIYYRRQDWRHMLYDSNAVEADLSDARYVIRWKYLDTDVAKAYFPERKALIERAAMDGTKVSVDEDDDIWYMGSRVTEPGQDFASSAVGKYRPYDSASYAWTKRERVKLVECWYRKPVRRKYADLGDGSGAMLAEQLDDETLGQASTYDKVEMEIRVAIYCDAGLLWEGPSPYNHGRFPFVPIWAYRRGRDNAPYSPIRGMRDAQDGMNKRASKALWILSTNQVELEEGAVDDIEELRDEIARPDAIIIRRRGKELNVIRDNKLAEQHLMLMDRDRMMIQSISGVTDENLGRQTNADSGKAIIARQEQGSLVTTELFDNLRFSVQKAGEIELSLIEQFMDQERVVRLVGERGNPQFIDINKTDPATGEKLNDITASHADFFVSQQDYRDALRQAMFESLFDIVARLAQMSPEIAFKLLDLVVEMADVPNKDELVSRIRQLNGMRDPERDPTPEEQQAMQQQAQEQQMQKELMLARAQAELAELKAKAGKLDADAIDKRLEAMQTALEAAQNIAIMPRLGPVADNLMRGAGYVDKGPMTDVATQQEVMQASEAQQQMAQAEMQKQQAAEQEAMQLQAMEQQAMAEQAAAMQPQQGGMPLLPEEQINQPSEAMP